MQLWLFRYSNLLRGIDNCFETWYIGEFEQQFFICAAHSAIQSATTFLEKCRKVVLQTRKKSEFAKPLFPNLKKMWIYSINPPFFWSTTFLEPEKKSKFEEPFFSNQISRTRFLKPDFSNHFPTPF